MKNFRVLSKAEMKNVLGGSEEEPVAGCKTVGNECTVHIPGSGTRTGECGTVGTGASAECKCGPRHASESYFSESSPSCV